MKGRKSMIINIVKECSQGTNVTVGNGYYREYTKKEKDAHFLETLRQIREGTLKLVPIEKARRKKKSGS